MKRPMLFDIQLEETDEEKATKFISKLQSKGFIGLNKAYLKNYINADLSIALSHIKTNYKKYVLEGDWSEEKFEDVVNVIVRHRKMLIPSVFLKYGMMYDDGKLSRDIKLERMKYENNKSDEDDDLLEYFNKQIGR